MTLPRSIMQGRASWGLTDVRDRILRDRAHVNGLTADQATLSLIRNVVCRASVMQQLACVGRLTWYRLPAIMRLAGLRSRCTMGDGFLLCMYARPRDASRASSTARRSDTACGTRSHMFSWRMIECWAGQ